MRYRIVPERSQVWIHGSSTVHPIRATATGLEGWFEADLTADSPGEPIGGRVEIAVDRLRSGNRLVDRETRRRVDAKRHPTISGEITGVESVGTEGARVRGAIEFRGELADVAGELEVRRSGDGIEIEGEQRFDVRTWGLEPPALMAIRVHPEVTVRILIEAVPG